MARPAKSLWYNLGAMFGNIAAGVTADPKNPPARLNPSGPPAPAPPPPPPTPAAQPAHIVNQQVRELTISTPTGPVTLRRTVTDEIQPPPNA